jgi:hypothetical protein
MTIIIQDSFNRADSTTSLGVADSGQTWQVGGTATFGVIGNQGYAATSTQDNTGAYIPISNTIKDYKATITVPTIQTSTTNFFRFYPRVAFGTLLYYLAIEAYSTGYRISKRTSTGTTSIVATSTVIPVSGDTIRVDNKASGQMDVYINGTLIITATDNYMMDLSYGVGFGGKQSPTYRVDNFLVETIDTGTTLTLSLSDSIIIGESLTKRRQAYLSLTDGLTIGDTETSIRATINTLVRALSDSINMTDSITIRAMRYLTIFDLFSIVDSIGTTGGGNVAQTIKFKRGNEVDLPTLAEGEPAITMDTNKMFVGTPNGNRQIATLLVVDSVANLPIAEKSKQFLISGVLGGTGTADALYVCKKLSNDTYDWVQFV